MYLCMVVMDVSHNALLSGVISTPSAAEGSARLVRSVLESTGGYRGLLNDFTPNPTPPLHKK